MIIGYKCSLRSFSVIMTHLSSICFTATLHLVSTHTGSPVSHQESMSLHLISHLCTLPSLSHVVTFHCFYYSVLAQSVLKHAAVRPRIKELTPTQPQRYRRGAYRPVSFIFSYTDRTSPPVRPHSRPTLASRRTIKTWSRLDPQIIYKMEMFSTLFLLYFII